MCRRGRGGVGVLHSKSMAKNRTWAARSRFSPLQKAMEEDVGEAEKEDVMSPGIHRLEEDVGGQ